MSSIRITEWLNSNNYRSYPFVDISGAPSEYISELCSLFVYFKIYLYNIDNNLVKVTNIKSNYLDIEFGNYKITIPRKNGNSYNFYSIKSSKFDLNIIFGICDTRSDIPNYYIIEPSLCVIRDRHYLGNIYGADDCKNVLNGSVYIKCGYGVSVNKINNRFIFSARPGFGDIPGYPCDYISKISDCSKKIFKINNVAPNEFGVFDISVDDSMDVSYDKDDNSKIYLRSNIDVINPICKKQPK